MLFLSKSAEADEPEPYAAEPLKSYSDALSRGAALLRVSPTLFVPQVDRVDVPTVSNQLELGHHDVVSRTQGGIFISQSFGARQVVAPLSFDGVRPSLLRFDFLPQLEHFVPNTAERYG
ncbi:hypothetical protein AC630_12720 [Bradyrhizobium sp. AS23.2]|nr:hypothetical protein AC630_12720 [Bradyrhizobium sp. AS23.2]